VIFWENITRIGDDIILVDVSDHKREKRSKKFWI
jgi:sporulation protein YlmC with PRC-barrel domain